MRKKSLLANFKAFWINLKNLASHHFDVYKMVNASFPVSYPGFKQAQPVVLLFTDNPSITIEEAATGWWKNGLENGSLTKVMLIDPKDWWFMLDSFGDLFDLVLRRNKQLILLTPYLTPPLRDRRQDGSISSFICSYELFVFCIKDATFNDLEHLCFQILSLAMTPGFEVDELLIRQLPLHHTKEKKSRKKLSSPLFDATLLIPHRGDLDFAKTCIHYVHKNQTQPKHIAFCFDESISEEHVKIIQRHQNIAFFHTQPTHSGPFIPRQHICLNAQSDYIIFQDTDDVPTTDRIQSFQKFVSKNPVDLVGSHEVRLDEFNQKVVVVRYPLDPYYALSVNKDAYVLCQSHSMVSKNTVVKSGGFSTKRKFGYGPQFVLRFYFYSRKIANIDEFLYVRRKHSGSLTTAEETAAGSPYRQKFIDSWINDFTKIKEGKLRIEDSSLAVEHNKQKISVISIDRKIIATKDK